MEIVEKSPLDPALPNSTFFHIGQDLTKAKSSCKNVYQSTIMSDYPAVSLTTRRSRVPSPKPANIFSREGRINEHKSLTATHFVNHPVTERPALSEVAKLGLGTKNLTKMEMGSTAMSFDTSHKVYFPARVFEKVKAENDLMKSSIPQGDVEKIRLPPTNYEQNFEEDKLSKLEVSMPAQFETPPLLRGDARSYEDQFETTNSKTFCRKCITPKRLKPIKNNGCSIRHGDPDKCLYSVTTNQKFFKEKPLERVEPCGPNYVSNIILGDINGKWSLSNYKTSREPFPRTETQHLVGRIAKQNMAKSNIPAGDMDPNRALQRITQTTSKTVFKKPLVLTPYARVNGAYLLTKSKVKFGPKDTGGKQHYSTTTGLSFPAKCQPVKRSDCQATNSNVCLNYYGNGSYHSTTVSDFCPHDGVKRLLHNPKRMAKLTASHIQLPKALTSELSTSHNSSYPPKQTKRESYEAGRLHKSSIKLGSLNVY